MISKLTCKRCHHQWIMRKEELPRTCPHCKSPYWDKEKRVLLKIKYLDYEDIIEINKRELKKLPVKKADVHKVLSLTELIDISNRCREQKGDVWDKAVYLLREIVKKHPFASGNRRTSLTVAALFLKQNNEKLGVRNVKEVSRVMQGSREDFYLETELKNWLMRGEIRDFDR